MYQQFLESFDNVQGRQPAPEQIECRVQDAVAVVVISNERSRNALSLGMWKQIDTVFTELSRTDQLRAVVLRGAGTAAFAAGANIAEFPENRFDSVHAAQYNNHLTQALRAVAELEVPTIAMIRGFAVGGGCELTAACDLRVGAEDARMGIPIGRLGVILGLTESRLLVRHLGVNGLKRILFSGELFPAEECLRLGLLDEITPTEHLAARVDELLSAIVSSSATTMAAAKVITDLADQVNDREADKVSQFMMDAYDGSDMREGVNAFLEKRRPAFSQGAA